MNATSPIALPCFTIFLLATCVLGAGRTDAQELEIPEAVYPKLARTAARPEDFAPPGWLLESLVSTDLNRDRIGDVVFVLREDNPANVLANTDGLGESPFDTNPRILAVAFADAGGTRYRLMAENHTLIPRRDSPTSEDPFDETGGLTAARGAFTVRLGFFSSAGGWEMGESRLTFRYQNERFEMIGFDSDTTHRASGEVTKIGVNYSTGVMEIRTGSIENDKEDVERLPLAPGRPMSMDDVGDGLAFSPTE